MDTHQDHAIRQHIPLKTLWAMACENVRGMDARAKSTWMYSRRFSQAIARGTNVDGGTLGY